MTCILLAVVIPTGTILGPSFLFQIQDSFHFSLRYFFHFEIAYAQQIEMSLVISVILAIFGIYFMRVASRRDRVESGCEQ